MKISTLIKQQLTESYSNKPLIIVDIQPSYSKWCDYIINENFLELLNSRKKILWFFNGEDVGIEDKKSDIFEWLMIDHDFSDYYLEPIFEKTVFKEKTYGMLREFMDTDVPDYITIKVLREMINRRVWNASDIPEDELIEIIGEDDFYEYLNPDGKEQGLYKDIWLNDNYIGLLKKYENCNLIGGGKHECLKEIKLIMNAFNIKYKELKEFIY